MVLKGYAVPAAVLAVAIALTGCQAIRLATGRIKSSPNEFAIVAFAPLVIPPDMNLRPPQPGEPPRTQLASVAQARIALFPQPDLPEAPMLANAYSDGERFLIQQAAGSGSAPNIQNLAAAPAAVASSNEMLVLRRRFDR